MATKRKHLQSLLVVMLLLGACAVLAGTQKKAPSSAKAPAAAVQPSVLATKSSFADSGVAAALTRRLTASTGLTDAVAATREALALGGLSTWDGQRFLVEAAAPAASGFVIPEETVALAMEARQRLTAGRLTLAQLGDMLKDLGWPFQEGRIPGEQMREIFRAWVIDGLAQPSNRFSFTPLFLREMALTQQPAIDLAKGDYDPEHLHLTLLELELFTAHFDRISGQPAQAAWPGIVGLGSGLGLGSDLGFSMPAPQAAPCSELKEWLKSTIGDLGDSGQAAAAAAQVIISDSVELGLKKFLQAAGFSEGTAQEFGKALSALSIASRLLKLVALYSQAQVAVTVGDNPIHAPSTSEAKKTDVFRAQAGVSDRDWQAYQQAMTSSDVVRGLRDCFRDFGLPVLSDLGDIGKEAKDWHVEWRLQGPPDRVRINADDNTFVHPGFLRVNMKPDGDHSAAALFTVEILPEKGKTHSGPEKQATAVASAALHTAKPPSISVWVNAVKGGLGNILALSSALVELCAGWIEEMLPPKAYASLAVDYHEGAGAAWTGRITYRMTKMLESIESGRFDERTAYMNYHVDFYHSTATVNVGGGGLSAKTQLEEIWDLEGVATVVLREDHLTDNWREKEYPKTGIATFFEKNSHMMNAGGTGPVTGRLMISNDGTYTLTFEPLPEVTGETETQWDYWWENNPGVEDEHHEKYSDPKSASGPDIYIGGKMDPKKPGLLSGRYEVKEPNGETITVTWNLKPKY